MKSCVRLLETATIAQASPPLAIAFNEAHARKRLARRIVAALDAGGLDTRLTNDRAAAVADGDCHPSSGYCVRSKSRLAAAAPTRPIPTRWSGGPTPRPGG